MKTAKDYMEAANASVPKMSAEDAIAKHAAGQGTFVDVRDSAAIEASGTVHGVIRVPRGMIEFVADPRWRRFTTRISRKMQRFT
jgi:hypothetical protein